MKKIIYHRVSLLISFSLLVLIISCDQVGKEKTQLEKVTINEAVRTLLYLPLYHAESQGFFKKNGIEIKIVTGGTATTSFAALLSGDADFSQADPMYVPISNEKKAETKVVAQVVARIAVWGLTLDKSVIKISKDNLKGKIISTHPRPMTAYTYANKTIKDFGLIPDKDVKILQCQPGTEIQPLLLGKSDFLFTIEPNASIAESKGAHVVLSYPQLLGDQIFTGLMTRNDIIDKKKQMVLSVLRSYQEALDDIHKNPEAAIKTAKKYFPQVDPNILENAIHRMVRDSVIPTSVMVPQKSWEKAVRVRLASGDLKHYAPLITNCALQLMMDARNVEAIQK
jgi:NitT/TauT family transport system substrate-binding protein